MKDAARKQRALMKAAKERGMPIVSLADLLLGEGAGPSAADEEPEK